MNPRHSLLAAALAASACSGSGASVQGLCEEVGSTRQQVLAEDRNILGRGGAYPADMMLRGKERELYRSQTRRREAAWKTIEKVLTPVALAKELANAPASQIPLWQTWYAKDDTTRLFQYLYEGLNPERQGQRARFAQESIDAALGWNETEVEDLANWPLERREAYLDAIDSAEKLAGIGGISAVNYSPSALRHLLRSYPEILSCLQGGVPGPYVDPPGDTIQHAVREPVALGQCESRQLGPFFVSMREALTASVSGDGSEAATVTVREGGEGYFFVDVAAGPDGLVGVVQIDYAAADAPWAACLEGAFATDSVVVKASWRRAQFGEQLPVYDTSAEALGATLSANAAEGWGEPVREADPGPDGIYTVQRPSGSRYRLAALHIMSKELEHWQWTTLWWSDTPEQDFGEDRPASIAALGAPWSQYKMCTVTMFDEGDADPTGGFSETAPSLAAALASVHAGAGGPSWCSNPYIEEGEGNMGTNCIGCHQHGGTDLLSEDILGTNSDNPNRYPEFGRTQLRNNFPHDYSWAPNAGDELTLAFKAVVDFFDN